MSTPAPASTQEPAATPPEPEPKSEPEATGWEEPTTAQAPTWDDEPSAKPTVESTPDGWITSVSKQPEPKQEVPPAESIQPEPTKQPESEQLPAPSAFPAQLGLQQKNEGPAAPAKPLTPVSYARSLNSRASNRFKATDQAVVMPPSFGPSVEKLGMQFGSVNLNGDDVETAAYVFKVIFSKCFSDYCVIGLSPPYPRLQQAFQPFLSSQRNLNLQQPKPLLRNLHRPQPRRRL